MILLAMRFTENPLHRKPIPPKIAELKKCIIKLQCKEVTYNQMGSTAA